MKNLVFFFGLAAFISCQSDEPDIREFKMKGDFSNGAETEEEQKFDLLANAPDDRTEIKKRLQVKVDTEQPLVVHCLVPLCDNVHQGIVPTTESLGDGFSLRTNLYWATTHGMKNFFVKSRSWRQLSISNFNVSDTILERVAFERKFENGAKVVLVCDAYRGDMMEPCLNDYFLSLGGYKADSINYGEGYLGVSDKADMVAFNGHNGLMDVSVDTVYAREERLKDAVVIACSSKNWFNPYFVQTNSYPLVNTTSLLWPGAMCLNRVIEHWATFKTDEVICNGAGDAYHEVKECGQQSARNMFYTGW